MTTVTHQDRVIHSMGKTQRIMLRAIEWYQGQREGALSPCRFFPTCSSYAHDAIVHYGPWRGCWMAARRLGRCRPFGPSGYDPVPNTDGCCDQLHHRPHEKG